MTTGKFIALSTAVCVVQFAILAAIGPAATRAFALLLCAGSLLVLAFEVPRAVHGIATGRIKIDPDDPIVSAIRGAETLTLALWTLILAAVAWGIFG